jgi:cell wall assembly regulator SMI1/ankyrin repeat protein
MADHSPEFMQAISLGKLDRVKELLAAGESPNELGGWSFPPLATAAQKGQTEVVNLLLDAGAEIDGVDQFNNTPLVHAAREGHLDAVRALIARRAKLNHQANLYTPLSAAASGKSKAYLNIVKALLATGADVEFGAPSPLVEVCKSSSADVVRTLIAAGAAVHRILPGWGSPLTRAIEGNRADIVEVLLAAGANPAQRLPDDFVHKDMAGKSALEIARAKKAKKLIPLLESPVKPEAASEKAPDVASSWKKIEASLKKKSPALRKRLNKGATDAQLQEVETATGLKLPADFVAAYTIHNGNQDGPDDLSPPPEPSKAGYFLLATEDIVAEWRSWKQLLDGGEFAGRQSGPDRGIRDAWWHFGWLPFALNGGGDSYCLDLAPTPDGKVGQVITMSHETAERKLLTPSFAQWLADLAESLEGGELKE